MKIYRILVVILGVVGYMIFRVYQDSLAIMYPDHNQSFARMFNGLVIIGLIIGAFFPLKSLHGTLSTIGSSILILLSIATIVSGLTYAYNVKTEEFLIYFLLTALTTLAFSIALTAIARFLVYQSVNGKEIIQVLSGGLIGVLIGYVVNILLGSVDTIYLWMIITTLLLMTFFITRREKVSTLA